MLALSLNRFSTIYMLVVTRYILHSCVELCICSVRMNDSGSMDQPGVQCRNQAQCTVA
jgi:hypothetical protein